LGRDTVSTRRAKPLFNCDLFQGKVNRVFFIKVAKITVTTSDNFWSAFCVFHAHFWGKTHSFKICARKKRNDFRQLKRSNFSVEVQNRGDFIKVLE